MVEERLVSGRVGERLDRLDSAICLIKLRDPASILTAHGFNPTEYTLFDQAVVNQLALDTSRERSSTEILSIAGRKRSSLDIKPLFDTLRIIEEAAKGTDFDRQKLLPFIAFNEAMAAEKYGERAIARKFREAAERIVSPAESTQYTRLVGEYQRLYRELL